MPHDDGALQTNDFALQTNDFALQANDFALQTNEEVSNQFETCVSCDFDVDGADAVESLASLDPVTPTIVQPNSKSSSSGL